MLTSVANDTAWTPYIQDAVASYFGPNESDWPEVAKQLLEGEEAEGEG